MRPFTFPANPKVGDATPGNIGEYENLYTGKNSRAQAAQWVTLPRSPYGSSSLNLRMECLPTDGVKVPPLERQRIQVDAPKRYHGPGEDIWMSLAVMLDPTFPMDGTPGQYQVIAELYPVEPPTINAANLILEVNQGQWRLFIRGGNTERGRAEHSANVVVGPAAPGAWEEFLIHQVLSTGSAGHTQLWRRQAYENWTELPQVDLGGATLQEVGGVTGAGGYPSLSIYRWDRPEQVSVVYFYGQMFRPTRLEAEALFYRGTF